MKAKDMKIGVLYGYRQSEYDPPVPIVVLHDQIKYVQFHKNFGSGGERPIVRDLSPHNAKRCAVRDGFGYVAVSSKSQALGRTDRDDLAKPQTHLLRVEFEDVLPLTVDHNAIHNAVPGHPGAYLRVIDPRYIEGEWDDVFEAWCAAKDFEKFQREDKARREKEGRERQTDLIARFKALGVKAHQSGYSNVTLTGDMAERVLSLIPEGTVFEEPWEYPKPEGPRAKA